MSRQESDILNGVSETLARLWKQRDFALEYEKNHDIRPRTSKRYLEAQKEIDDLFLPKENKAQRKKPKKKVYMPDPDWAY